MHSYHKGAFFRQWLLRPDCPPFLRYCRLIFDHIYGYKSSSQALADNDLQVIDVVKGNNSPSDLQAFKIPPPAELLRRVGYADIVAFTRIEAQKGAYAIASPQAAGNSYICFKPIGDYHGMWRAGQIQHLFEHKGIMKMAIKVCVELDLSTQDPFKSFWEEGFQAKMVSTKFLDDLQIVDVSRVIAHVVRWEMTNDIAVVLNLSTVGSFF